jgi:glycosyltransferase involved in cell wall biosynthesis
MDYQISAFMICKNEEKVIERALQSLSWADELIVVDGFSSDGTIEIVRRFTDKVFQREWTNFGEQRNFALSKCKYPWVFFLDADEVCSPDLIGWMERFKELGPGGVQNTVADSTSAHPLQRPSLGRVDLYEIRRWEHFRGILYQFGANNPSHQWRFFRREGAKFVGDVHEYPVVEGRIVRLEKPIYHYPKDTLSDMVAKMNRYSSFEAEQMFKRGVIHSAGYMLFSGFAMFIKSYFRKQGFRDGVLGFILAALNGGGFFLRQAKLYLKNAQAGRLTWRAYLGLDRPGQES